LAQKDPLKVEISAFNGASDLNVANPQEPQDPSIRVVVALTNLTAKKVKVTKIACTFFDGNGQQLGQDQAQPLEVSARGQQTAVLFYPNGASLFAFKATGVLEYEQNGQTFSVPINVDQTAIRTQPTGYP
jgi:hypothetical protein